MMRRSVFLVIWLVIMMSDPVYPAKNREWLESFVSVMGRTLIWSMMVIDHCQAATNVIGQSECTSKQIAQSQKPLMFRTDQCHWTEQSNAEMMYDSVMCHANPTARRLKVDRIPDDYHGDLIYSQEWSNYYKQWTSEIHRDNFYISDIRSEKGSSINHQFIKHGFDFISLKEYMDLNEWLLLCIYAEIMPAVFEDLVRRELIDARHLGLKLDEVVSTAIQKWAEKVYDGRSVRITVERVNPWVVSDHELGVYGGSLHCDNYDVLQHLHDPSDKSGINFRVWISLNPDRTPISNSPLVVYDPMSFPDPMDHIAHDSTPQTNKDFLFDHVGSSDAYWKSQMDFGDAVVFDVDRVPHQGLFGITGRENCYRMALVIQFSLSFDE